MVDDQGTYPFYKLTFNPYHPTMAFLGTVNETMFSFCDMQVMWTLRVWLGQQSLPQTVEMLVDCKNRMDTSSKDLTVLYKELATYSETQTLSSSLLDILKQISNKVEKKLENYIVSEHWIVTIIEKYYN